MRFDFERAVFRAARDHRLEILHLSTWPHLDDGKAKATVRVKARRLATTDHSNCFRAPKWLQTYGVLWICHERHFC